MRNLEEYAEFCMEMLDEIGVPYTRPENLTVNTRSQRWGQCKRANATGKFYIDVNITLLDERNGEDGLINTLLHELLHTCPGCMNHGEEWKKWARLVKIKYGYDIKRCSDNEEKEIITGNLNARQKKYRYFIYCKKCGKLVARKQRSCDIVENTFLYQHKADNGELYCMEDGFQLAANI